MDAQEIKDLFNYLEYNQEHLSELQIEFITSLKKDFKWTGVLTNKQMEILSTIRDFLPVTAG